MIKTSDVRRAKIVALASVGTPINIIADEFNMSSPTVSKILRLQGSQEQLANVIGNLNDQLNLKLPIILEKSLNELDNLLSMPGLDYVNKLKAIELTLKVATKLSELSLKAK